MLILESTLCKAFSFPLKSTLSTKSEVVGIRQGTTDCTIRSLMISAITSWEGESVLSKTICGAATTGTLLLLLFSCPTLEAAAGLHEVVAEKTVTSSFCADKSNAFRFETEFIWAASSGFKPAQFFIVVSAPFLKAEPSPLLYQQLPQDATLYYS